MPKHPLQSGSFAVNCMYQKDGAAQSAPFQRMEQGIPAENLEEYGMLELLRSVPRLLERPELGYALLDMENVLEDDCSAAWLRHASEL